MMGRYGSPRRRTGTAPPDRARGRRPRRETRRAGATLPSPGSATIPAMRPCPRSASPNSALQRGHLVARVRRTGCAARGAPLAPGTPPASRCAVTRPLWPRSSSSPTRSRANVPLHQPRGRVAQEHGAWRRGPAGNPGREMRGVADRRVVHAQVVADRADDHEAGVQSHPHGQAHLAAALHQNGRSPTARRHADAASASAAGVVLVSQRRAEERHEAVAEELVHGALDRGSRPRELEEVLSRPCIASGPVARRAPWSPPRRRTGPSPASARLPARRAR
jgi:hypothetical protein